MSLPEAHIHSNPAGVSNILIVDDERNILKSLNRLLATNNKFCVETFDDPKQALDRMGQKNFDIIVADYHMGEMNGVDLLEQSLLMSPNSSRILLSGMADMNVLAQSINRCSIHHYVPKPWDDAKLLQILTEASHACHERKEKDKVTDMLASNKHVYSLTRFAENIIMDDTLQNAACQDNENFFQRIRTSLEECFSLLGFEYFSYENYVIDGVGTKSQREIQTVKFSNCPEELIREERGFAHKKNDPVFRAIMKKALIRQESPVTGSWLDIYQWLAEESSTSSEIHDIARRHGVNSGAVMCTLEDKKLTVVHLTTRNEPGKITMEPSTWKTVQGIIQFCNQALHHIQTCPYCSKKQSNEYANIFKLTEKQKEILKTFMDDSASSIKSASRIHNISIDSVNFHLKNIRAILDKPRTSPHALATLARNMNLL